MRLTGTGLEAERGGRSLFKGLSFAAEAGGLVAVTGPNGSGKSTLLRMIAGLAAPAAGAIALDPASEGGVGAECHYLGHLDALKGGLTLAENLGYWRRVMGGDSGATVDEALDQVGLGALGHLRAAVLSAGQKRRAAIARLIAAKRPIWLLDEPTASLDRAGEELLGRLAEEHLEAGGIVIAATHRDLPVRPAQVVALGRTA
jgi:heme exporter protein A